jgi:Ni/Fe-hydrogenase subunit HybB-like protein
MTMAETKTSFNQITRDLTGHVNMSKGFRIWMTFLIAGMAVCLYAYYLQLKNGLSVTGVRDYISWGIYLSNFVFFVASSLIGMLISGVLGMIGIKWITPITRIAEIIAIAFSAIAGLVIVMDMGRPERLAYVFIYGRFQSPILWDVTVVTTYFVLSSMLYYLTLIPDLALTHNKINGLPGLFGKIYKALSLNWADKKGQNEILHRSVRILILLIIPSALAIHTVTSWLFALTLRPGWDSSIFGPYFVSGAFVAGSSAVIIAMYIFRNQFKLKDYLTDMHFNNMGKLLVLVSLVYLYFNINEFLVPGYKLRRADAIHLSDLFAGHNALMFWAAQIGGLLLPIILMLFRKMRRPAPIMMISVAVLLGSWFKRFIIVIPAQEHPFLPVQHVPLNFKVYTPTLTEVGITLVSFFLVLIIITLLSKLFPVIPVYETAKEKGIEPEPNAS